MKKHLTSRAKKLEERLRPQKAHGFIAFRDTEWDKLDKREQAEIREKHSQVMIVQRVIVDV